MLRRIAAALVAALASAAFAQPSLVTPFSSASPGATPPPGWAELAFPRTEFLYVVPPSDALTVTVILSPVSVSGQAFLSAAPDHLLTDLELTAFERFREEHAVAGRERVVAQHGEAGGGGVALHREGVVRRHRRVIHRGQRDAARGVAEQRGASGGMVERRGASRSRSRRDAARRHAHEDGPAPRDRYSP